MKIRTLAFSVVFILLSLGCKKQQAVNGTTVIKKDTSLVNTGHLDYLYTPVVFATGGKAAGVYIYSEAPDYHLVAANGEGFTCVDDVSRAVLVYVRNPEFQSDTSTQNKVFNLVQFLLEMQSSNGYFYNFLLPGDQINTGGQTSINIPSWWSWRALQALTEATPSIKGKNPSLALKMDLAVSKLVTRIKVDLANLPLTTKVVNGITVPQWLPNGSGADQAAIMILGLIPYCVANNDADVTTYVKKLAEGIILMQQGDANNFPYGAFLSWENSWHAYGADQALALMKAGVFLNDSKYTLKALMEVDNYYPWLLQNGLISSFVVLNDGTQIKLASEKTYEQIAYGLRPMVSAATEAFRITGQQKYADIAGHLAAWFFGANDARRVIYDPATGICFDGINGPGSVNTNSGAESTIEALLTMETVENYPAVKTALSKYK